MSLFGGPLSTRIQCVDVPKLEQYKQKEAEAAAKAAAARAASSQKPNSSGSQKSKTVLSGPLEPPKPAFKPDLYAFDDLADDSKPAAKPKPKSVSPSPPPASVTSQHSRPSKGSGAAGHQPKSRLHNTPATPHGQPRQQNGNHPSGRHRQIDRQAGGSSKPGSSGPGRPTPSPHAPFPHHSSRLPPAKPHLVHTSLSRSSSPAPGKLGMNGRLGPEQSRPGGKPQQPGLPSGAKQQAAGGSAAGRGPAGGKPSAVAASATGIPGVTRVSSIIHAPRPAPHIDRGPHGRLGNGVPRHRPGGRPGAGYGVDDDDDDSYEEDDFVVGDDEEPDWRREMDRILGPRKKRMYAEDDFDDRGMEVGWREITREEGRSAALARLEDQREAEEEERRLAAKRQKLGKARA